MFLVDLVMVLQYSKYPREALLWVSSRSSIRKLLKTLSFHMSSMSFTGVLEDRDVLDGAGNGVKVLNISQRSFTESFIKIQHQEVCQDSTYPPSHFLESCRKGMFLMGLEMVSRNSIYPREVLLRVSSRSNIRKFVKTPAILQVTSWSLGGKGCSWWSWR